MRAPKYYNEMNTVHIITALYIKRLEIYQF